jgi:hypothetical protein
MRTSNSDTKKLGYVEPSATNKGGRHTKRFELVGKSGFCGKAKRSKKEKGSLSLKQKKGWRMKHPTAKLT